MKHSGRHTRILIFVAFIALLVIPVTIFLASRPQANISKAATGTSLIFDPTSSESEPIEINAGDDLSLDLQVEPGDGNLITFVKFVIEYDPEVFDVTEEDFTPNENDFAEILEGPTVADGLVTGSLSVGSDPTLALTDPTSLGEIIFHAKKSSPDITTIAYSADSEALSIGPDDSSTESVLTNAGAAFIQVDEGQPAEETTDTPPSEDDGTTITFLALLDGIGSAGDSTNPKNNSLSNKTPKTEKVPTTVAILDDNGEDVARTEGDLIYDQKTGKFAGSFTMDTFVPTGTYTILVEANKYLPFEIEVDIADENGVELDEVSLIAGDIVPDGTLNILDYNALSDCGYGSGIPLPMSDPKSAFKSVTCQKNENASNADLDDNGIINILDFNLFLRELFAQSKN